MGRIWNAVKAVDQKIMDKAAGSGQQTTPGKIKDPVSTKCQMPSGRGGKNCTRDKTSPNADTCGSPECAKVWAQIHDTSHSTHRHGTSMRKKR